MDWVDAADPTAFAGTTGSSLRMEAFEIVVLPKNEFYYLNNRNGTHTVSYNGKLGATEDCVYGDYTVSGNTFTKACALCGYSNNEAKTLKDVLKDAQLDGQSKVTLGTVSVGADELTIPEGMTLEVTDTLTVGSKEVEVYGHLIAKSISDESNKLVCKGDGVVTLSGVYEDEGDLAKNLAIANKTGVKVDKIVMEEGSDPQELSSTATLSDKVDLTLDLNGTEVAAAAGLTKDEEYTYTSKAMIYNNGKLTITDGVIDVGTSLGICSTGTDSELVVSNCTIKGEKAGKAITIGTNKDKDDKNVVATITDTKIETNAGAATDWSVTAFGTGTVVNMKNVEIKSKNGCVATNNQDSNITIVGDNVKLTSENCAAYLASSGKYTFSNSTVTGAEGIEYISGTLTLNNTTVKATRSAQQVKLTPTDNGNATHSEKPVGGTEHKFGAAIQIKVFKDKTTDKAVLSVDSDSKLESAYGPAILVFTDATDKVPDGRVELYYPTSKISGYTEATEKGDTVVWAIYKVAV